MSSKKLSGRPHPDYIRGNWSSGGRYYFDPECPALGRGPLGVAPCTCIRKDDPYLTGKHDEAVAAAAEWFTEAHAVLDDEINTENWDVDDEDYPEVGSIDGALQYLTLGVPRVRIEPQQELTLASILGPQGGGGGPLSAPDNNPKARVGNLKAPLHLVPPSAEYYIALALKDGAVKYGPYNWRSEAISISTYVGAIRRHLNEWWDGEDDASDSGVHHVAHIMASCALILDAMSMGMLRDDRPPQGAMPELLKEYMAAQEEADA